jgi:hypothetical protein
MFIIVYLIARSRSHISVFTKANFLKVLPLILISFLYVNFITNSSAKLGGVSSETLTYLGVNELYGKTTDNFTNLGEFSDSLYNLVYAGSYLYHGQWTAQFAYSLSESQRIGNYTLYPFSIILSKLNLISSSLDPGYFSTSGAFISLPGSFYYDAGAIGVFLFSCLLGISLGIVLIIINYGKNIDGLKLAFIVYILYIVQLSPIMAAYGFSYLNFIVFSFIILALINRIVFRRKSNWLEIK